MTAATNPTGARTGSSKVSGMTAVTLKGLWANKSRFGLSSLAVIISVAFLTAMLILTTALAGTTTDDLAVANAGVDVVVLGEELGLGEGPPGAEAAVRSMVDVSTIDALLAVDGVDAAVGIRTTTAQLLGVDGAPVVTGSRTSLGETWIDNETLATFDLVAGTAPVDGIVVDRSLADEAGLVVGDTVQVLTPIGTEIVSVDGIATFGEADSAPDTATILFADGNDLLGTGGFERVVVDTDLDPTALQGAAGNGEVQSGTTYVTDQQSVIEARTSFQTIFFLAFALIALIAGTTIIYNTFVIAVAQRTRELALLRSIGASKAQVLKAVMGEAAVVGVVASVVGAVVGIGSAYGLVALFEALGLSILAGSLSVTVDSLVIGAGVGLVVTLVSAFVPARKAANTPPIAALREAAVDPSGVSLTRNSVAGLLLVGGSGLALFGSIDGTWETAVGGVLAAFIGVVVGGPMIAGWVSRGAGAPLALLGGAVGRLASTNAARNPRRSASTALALTLGVALIAFFTVVASSLSGTVAADTDAALSADQVVSPFAALGGPDDVTYLPPSVADGIELGDGVEAVVPLASTNVFVDGSMALAAGADVRQLDQVYDLAVVAGSLAEVSDASIAVQAGVVDGVVVGDEVTLVFPQAGQTSVRVAAIFETNLPGQVPAQYLFDDAALAVLAPDAGDAVVFVSTDGSDAAQSALAASVEATGGAIVQTADEYIESLGSSVDAFLNFVYALLGVAVIIAFVGIANTTVMAIGERTKEIGMLRSVGMTAVQVRRMIRNEALLLSLQGSVVGLAIGVGGVYATFSAIGDDQFTLDLPLASLATIGVAAAVSGVAAAAWPAWRASRRAPLEAIAG